MVADHVRRTHNVNTSSNTILSFLKDKIRRL